MYDNIGKGIKVLAMVLGSVLLSVGVLAWIVFISQDNQPSAWSFLVGGIVGYFSSAFLYAFGQLVEDTQLTREILQLWHKEYSHSKTTPEKLEEKVSTLNKLEKGTINKKPAAPSVGTSIHNAVPARGYTPTVNEQKGKELLETPDFAE